MTPSTEDIAMNALATIDTPEIEATDLEPWVHPYILGVEHLGAVDRYTLYVERQAEREFLDEIKKLNKLIKRHGTEITIVDRQFSESTDWLGRIQTKLRYVFDAPAVAGEKAKLAGTFELAEDGVQIYTTTVPGYSEDQIAPFKARWQECDHCGYDRKRHASFVCEREDGEFVLIGRNCSRAYLGLSPADLLARAAVAKLIEGNQGDEEGFFGFSTASKFHVESKVREAYRVAKHLGGYSKGARELFYQHMAALRGAQDERGSRRFANIRREYEGKPIPEINLAAFAEYIRTARDDYGANLRTALSMEYAKTKRIGTVVSGVGMFVGDTMKRAVETKAMGYIAPAKLLDGPDGARVDFVTKVLKVFPYEGRFGAGKAVIMRSVDGSNCIHFTTGEFTPEAGSTYAVRATIKKHGQERGGTDPQTVVTRATYKAVE
jgi:hypothetical protein